MNLAKSMEYFNPHEVGQRLHIIGCGSVGSTLAELLARFGLTKFSLYDFDKVEPKNIVNQMFFENQIGMNKAEAVRDIICSINREAEDDIKIYDKGWTNQRLSGYVFLCVDSIEIRKKIVKSNEMNRNIKAMFDFRTRLEDAQHYAADWSEDFEREALWNSMDFTEEEAKDSTPVSACGVVLGVAPVVRAVCEAGVSNFINFAKGKDLKKMILVNPFDFTVNAM